MEVPHLSLPETAARLRAFACQHPDRQRQMIGLGSGKHFNLNRDHPQISRVKSREVPVKFAWNTMFTREMLCLPVIWGCSQIILKSPRVK